MFKLVTVAGKSWWVPEGDSAKLAVQISDPEEYWGAIRSKLLDLIAKEGGPEKAAKMAREIFDLGRWDLDTEYEDLLVRQLLALCRIGEMVREGGPDMAEPASAAEAIESVQYQEELTLADFLGG